MNEITSCLTPWALAINAFQSHLCSNIYMSGLPSDSYSFVQYYPYFLKTFILELPIYFFIFRSSHSFFRMIFVNLILNLATHPFIFLILPVYLNRWQMNYLQYLCIAEIYAPLIEGGILWAFGHGSFKRSFTAAILANLFSWSVGVYWI